MKFFGAVVFFLSGAAFLSGAEPRVVDRGPHHRTWETTREVQTANGETRTETGSYIELQGGLHRWTDQGWIETDPRIEVFRDGAVARNLQYQAIFAPNLATPGAIDLLLPDGQRLQGHLLGLAYTEGNQSVLIAEVKDCAGVIGGAEQNEVTFADAFTDFNISVQFVLQRDRISQNVIVHQQLPHPSEWGLTEDAVLEVLTEFTTVPAMTVENREAVNLNPMKKCQPFFQKNGLIINFARHQPFRGLSQVLGLRNCLLLLRIPLLAGGTMVKQRSD